MLLIKLVNTGLFDKSHLRRLVGFSHYTSSSYNKDLDEYSVLPQLQELLTEPDTGMLKIKLCLNNLDKLNQFTTNTHKYLYFVAFKTISKNDILKLRVVIATEGTSGFLYSIGLKSGTFSHLFFDEAGQTLEPEMLLPLSRFTNVLF